MLIYSAHIPHSPALLRHISRSKIAIFRKTKNAMAEIADDIHALQSVTVPDITGMALSLSSLQHRIDDLQLSGMELAEQAAQDTAETPAAS